MLLVTPVVQIVTFAVSPRLLATYGGSLINQRDANPCKVDNALER